jgi:hypothetical protein
MYNERRTRDLHRHPVLCTLLGLNKGNLGEMEEEETNK